MTRPADVPAVVVRDTTRETDLGTVREAAWWEVGGSYTLVLSVPASAATVGALGRVDLPRDVYTYTGSALGAGGFGRVDRHRRLVEGDREVRHWHVDSLTGLDDTSLTGVVLSPDRDVECEVADRIERDADGDVVDGFGASDCACRAHLAGHRSVTTALDATRRAHVDAAD